MIKMTVLRSRLLPATLFTIKLRQFLWYCSPHYFSSVNSTPTKNTNSTSSVSYVQGQMPNPRTREYFYFIDHQGQLFMDDARMKNFTSCFKDKVFLEFFFKRLKPNRTDRFEEEFPFVSPCGRETNYVRCDDLPVVFTHLSNGRLRWGLAGDRLSLEFEPQHVYMQPESGRIYHPGPEKSGSVGLIRSALALELSEGFEFNGTEPVPDHLWERPTHLNYSATRYELSQELEPVLRNWPYTRLFQTLPE